MIDETLGRGGGGGGRGEGDTGKEEGKEMQAILVAYPGHAVTVVHLLPRRV